MFDKLFNFLGFNSGKSYVGLHNLVDNAPKLKPRMNNNPDKSLKLSDLMRGN